MGLVDIQKAQELAALAADIPELEECFSDLALNLQVEVDVVRRAEILVDAENAARIHSARESLRGNDFLTRHNQDRASRACRSCEGEYRIATAGIAFESVRCRVSGTIIQERIGVRRVKENSSAAADHGRL